MKGSYKSRRDNRIIDPTKLGGPYRGTLVWREDIQGPGANQLRVSGWRQQAEIGDLGELTLLSIGGMFALAIGQEMPRDGFFYQDAIGAVNPTIITPDDQNTLQITFPRAIEDGELWIIGEMVAFRGAGGERASDATIAYFSV